MQSVVQVEDESLFNARDDDLDLGMPVFSRLAQRFGTSRPIPAQDSRWRPTTLCNCPLLVRGLRRRI